MTDLGAHRTRMFMVLVICMVGLSYCLFWYSGLTQTVRMHTRLSMNVSQTSSFQTCFSQLLLDFGVNLTNLSVPSYVRLTRPLPVSPACADLVLPVPTTARRPANDTSYQLLGSSDRERVQDTVARLATAFKKRGLQLFLCGGSLLGSVRHFGLFPWDADADVMIPTEQKPRARQLLQQLAAVGEYRFSDTESSNGHWQLGILCQPGSSKADKQLQCKTIVDFFFGWTSRRYYRRLEYPYKFPIADVYPLKLRPYGPYLLPVPSNPERILTAVYGRDYESKCEMKYLKSKSFRCTDLRDRYPFVVHERAVWNRVEFQVDILLHGSSMLALFIQPR